DVDIVGYSDGIQDYQTPNEDVWS
nr:hypothetical protein [Tanacetum cinerariifolium]